jgi:hypothetical protein
MPRLLVVALLGLAACQRGYELSYTAYPVLDNSSISSLALLSDGDHPQILLTNDLDRDSQTLVTQGYVKIGRSVATYEYAREKSVTTRAQARGAVNSVERAKKLATDQAKVVGAMLVLVRSDFVETAQNPSGYRGGSQTRDIYSLSAIYFAKAN